MGNYLDIAAAIFAFAAAIFWFASASGKLPPMVAYFDRAPQTDPFYVAVKFSAAMNRWGAGFSGLSALCVGGKMFVA